MAEARHRLRMSQQPGFLGAAGGMRRCHLLPNTAGRPKTFARQFVLLKPRQRAGLGRKLPRFVGAGEADAARVPRAGPKAAQPSTRARGGGEAGPRGQEPIVAHERGDFRFAIAERDANVDRAG